jgi:hypothetical protein
MNSISIGGIERSLGDADAAWIRRQIDERLRSGQLPCVRVMIQTTSLHISLQTPNCGAGGGGGRAPNTDERKILDLWNMEGLSNPMFTARQVVDFVGRVKHLIR